MQKQHNKKLTDNKPFMLGDWHVDPASDAIAKDGIRVRLEPRVMEVLVFLAARPDEVASRQAIEEAVWTGTVVGYDALTSTMLKLRKALGDDSRHPRYIETVSKRGYRLIVDVRPAEHADAVHAGPPGQSSDIAQSSNMNRWLVFGLALILALALVLIWTLQQNDPSPSVSTSSSALSIAVLPFENISDDPSQQYYADGIVSDLITDLSGMPELAVIARDSAFLYRDEALERIRQELNVRYVLRGSVRRNADAVRVNAQLVDAETGHNIWAERFDADIRDSFAMQDAITERIAEALKVHAITGQQSMMFRYSKSVEAYDMFLRGVDHLARRSYEDLNLARSYFQQSIDLDPEFARAYAGMALVYLWNAVDSWEVNSPENMDKAKSLAGSALELNDRLAEVHFVNAFVDLFRYDYESAISSLNTALALRPSYADAYALLAWVQQFSGRPDLADSTMQRAIRLNPQTPSAYLQVKGESEFAAGRYADAVVSLEQSLEKSAAKPRGYIMLAAAYAMAERLEDANWTIEQLVMLEPRITRSQIRDAFPYRDDQDLNRLLVALERAGLPD